MKTLFEHLRRPWVWAVGRWEAMPAECKACPRKTWKVAKGVGAGLITGAIVVWGYLKLLDPDNSTMVTFIGCVLTAYLACYAIAWAKYEFHITRQSQQMSVLAALCATEKRKSFAPALAAMTRKKLPKYPKLSDPHIFLPSLFVLHDDETYLIENNTDTIRMVATLLRGFDDWRGANLNCINLHGAFLNRVNLSGARLFAADFSCANMLSANFKNTMLCQSNFCETIEDVQLQNSNMNGCKFKDVWFKNSNLSNASFKGIEIIGVEAGTQDFHDAVVWTFSDAKTLYGATFPPDIEFILRNERPHLFEKPEWYVDEDDN